jgi:hypothetical protein
MASKVVYVTKVTPLPGLDTSMVFASSLGKPVKVGDELIRVGTEEKYEVRSTGGIGVRFNPMLLKHLQSIDSWSFVPSMGQECAGSFLVEPGANERVLKYQLHIQEVFQLEAHEPDIPIAVMVDDGSRRYSGILSLDGKSELGVLQVVLQDGTPLKAGLVHVHLLTKVLGEGPAFRCSLKRLVDRQSSVDV